MTTRWTTRCIGAAILLLATVPGTAVSAGVQSANGDQTPTLRYPELSCFLGHEGTLTVLKNGVRDHFFAGSRIQAACAVHRNDGIVHVLDARKMVSGTISGL
jgi:hypothetical protein